MNTYGDIGNATAGWYSRKLLSHAVPVIVLERFSVMKTMPRNETRIMQFRRSRPFAPATTPLTEGVTPESQDFGYDTISVQIQQYGDWTQITDVVTDVNKDDVLGDIVQRQGEQIAETRELLTWDVLRAGTNVTYGNGSTRAGLNNTGKITGTKVRRMIADMHRNKGKMFTEVVSGSAKYGTYPVEASYVMVGHTDMNPDLREMKGSDFTGNNTGGAYFNPENTFTPVSKYGSMSPIGPREIGSFEDMRFITSPDLPPHKGAGHTTITGIRSTGNNADVYPMIMLAREAFGCIGLRGRTAARPMVLNPGTPRATDELGQRGSAGWKTWFACKILNDDWLLRFETVASL